MEKLFPLSLKMEKEDNNCDNDGKDNGHHRNNDDDDDDDQQKPEEIQLSDTLHILQQRTIHAA